MIPLSVVAVCTLTFLSMCSLLRHVRRFVVICAVTCASRSAHGREWVGVRVHVLLNQCACLYLCVCVCVWFVLQCLLRGGAVRAAQRTDAP